MANNLRPLLKSYDAFGWIPTIRGALSLDLMGWKNKIWGDVDMHATEFINYDGLSSERFLVATTLHNVSDSKYGKNYIRTFRYFFYGSIHNKNENEKLLKEIHKQIGNCQEESELQHLFNDGVLIGRIVIVREDDFKLSERETDTIKKIKDLEKAKKKYSRSFSIEADSLEKLDGLRADMKNRWIGIRHSIDTLREDNNHQYEFEVLLTRDGIIMLRDTTDSDYKPDYMIEGTASDYTCNIPIHRIFKNAMNFMKYLFHTNYHHEEEHDTFLPASNLHSYRQTCDFSGIFRHQMNAFLNPLMKLRKAGMTHFKMDPIGILCYTKSFIYVCKNNNLITEDETKRLLDHLSLLEADTNHNVRHHWSLLSSVATQRNILFIVTTILAFIVAVLKILDSGLKANDMELKDWFDGLPWYYSVVSLIMLGAIGYIIFEVSSSQITKRDFHINTARRRKNHLRNLIFNHDSDLEKRMLSWRLRMYIWIQNTWFLMWNPSQWEWKKNCRILKRFTKGKKRKKEKTEPNFETGKMVILISKIAFWMFLFVLSIYLMIKFSF